MRKFDQATTEHNQATAAFNLTTAALYLVFANFKMTYLKPEFGAVEFDFHSFIFQDIIIMCLIIGMIIKVFNDCFKY